MPTTTTSQLTKAQYSVSGILNGKPYLAFGTDTARNVTTTKVSVRTPNFATRSKKGLLAPLAYSIDITDDVSQAGTQTTKSSPGTKVTDPSYTNYTRYGLLSGTPSWNQPPGNPYSSTVMSPSDLSTADSRANNSILEKIKGSNVNVAVATAEARKTMTMVGDAAIKIASSIHDLRQGDFVGAARSLGVIAGKRGKSRFDKAWAKDKAKAVGSGWNSLSYGWKPLLADVYGVVAECNSAAQQGVILHVKSRKSLTSKYHTTYSLPKKPTGWYWDQSGVNKTDVSYGITFMRQLGAQQDLPRLGITNPALVAWELVPYSFVVDWFLPIGSFLGNLDATLGVTFVNGYKTTFQHFYGDQTAVYYDAYSQYCGLGKSSKKRVKMNRYVLTGFPAPSLPRFKNPMSFLHMTNGLALLTNLLKK